MAASQITTSALQKQSLGQQIQTLRLPAHFDLSGTETAVLMELARRCGMNSLWQWRVTARRLAAWTRFGISTVRRAMRRIVKTGIIEAVQVGNETVVTFVKDLSKFAPEGVVRERTPSAKVRAESSGGVVRARAGGSQRARTEVEVSGAPRRGDAANVGLGGPPAASGEKADDDPRAELGRLQSDCSVSEWRTITKRLADAPDRDAEARQIVRELNAAKVRAFQDEKDRRRRFGQVQKLNGGAGVLDRIMLERGLMKDHGGKTVQIHAGDD